MKHRPVPSISLAFLAGISLVTPVLAAVNIEWVTVGNAGNAADPATGYGAVGYEYKIGKYEVTNAQYVQFLNAKGASNNYGIYNASMSGYGITQSGSNGSYTYSVTGALANRPVVYVSWFDAARFANWLLNGQGSGDMENGAYTLNGAISGVIAVNPEARIHLPSEDEWYKAAYYLGNGTYSLYPNGQNSITTTDANYSNSVGALTDVGTYSGDASYYGTFDQGGNVWEWNDAVLSNPSRRGLRGGAWYVDASGLSSSFKEYAGPTEQDYTWGFRLVTVPEPASLLLSMLAGGVMLIRRKR